MTATAAPEGIRLLIPGILRKLGAAGRGEAVARGTQAGLVQNGQAAATT